MSVSAGRGGSPSPARSVPAQAPWDFFPPYDAGRRSIRNHLDLGELEAMTRFRPA